MNLVVLCTFVVSAVQLAPLSTDFDFLTAPNPRRPLTLPSFTGFDMNAGWECEERSLFSDHEERIVSGISKLLDEVDLDNYIDEYEPENRACDNKDKENNQPEPQSITNAVNLLPPFQPAHLPHRCKSSVNTATFLLHNLKIGLGSIETLRRNNYPKNSN